MVLRDLNWKMVMDDEYDALIKNKTWELVPRPPNVNVGLYGFLLIKSNLVEFLRSIKYVL